MDGLLLQERHSVVEYSALLINLSTFSVKIVARTHNQLWSRVHLTV